MKGKATQKSFGQMLFFLADTMYMHIFYLFLFLLVIVHELLSLGYITAGGDFGPRLGPQRWYLSPSPSLALFDHTLNVPVLGAVSAAVVVVSCYHPRGHFRA